jgi:predicted phosphoribosyltransferase
MRAAVEALRSLGPQRVTVAVPVGPPSTVRELEKLADEVVCPWQPPDFRAVGEAYRRFDQTEDAEVRSLLARRT